ncbi:MAG: hypothetical protein AB7O62_09955 [Pirellulales bacterium]
MEFNRNQYFLIGLVILFLGIEFRVVETFVLNERTTKFLAERSGAPERQLSSIASYLPSMGGVQRKSIRPPDWIGWALISVGSVLVLHSLAMKKPEGGH